MYELDGIWDNDAGGGGQAQEFTTDGCTGAPCFFRWNAPRSSWIMAAQ